MIILNFILSLTFEFIRIMCGGIPPLVADVLALLCYTSSFLTASLWCLAQGEDQANCLPVHTVQLGEVRVEACV